MRVGRSYPQRDARPTRHRAPARDTFAMTTTWTLHIDQQPATAGRADTAEQAREELATATYHAIAAAAPNQRPRYTFYLDGQLTGLLQTADDEHGNPDHASAAHLAERVFAPPQLPYDISDL